MSRIVPWVLPVLLSATIHAQIPVGSQYTYQGRLMKDGQPWNGPAVMRFTLHSDPVLVMPVTPVAVSQWVNVADGLFTVELDFGGSVFGADARWLQIEVDTDVLAPDFCDSGLCHVLSPRQRITPAPVALYALSGPPGSGSEGWIIDDFDGNGSDDMVSVPPGKVGIGIPIPSAKLHVVTSAIGDGVNLPGLRTSNTAVGVNVIAGGANNTFTPGRVGVTIAGGDGHSTGVVGDYGTIGGGFQNVAAQQATVSGGSQNTANAFRTTVGGGAANVANSTGATVGGGVGNRASAEYATVAGGGWSVIGDVNTGNRVFDHYGTVGGGANNRAGNDDGNLTTATYATVAGGESNHARALHATVGGGLSNIADQQAVVVGGYGNWAGAFRAFIGGGHANSVVAGHGTIGGGFDNDILAGTYSTIGGGQLNKINAAEATIAGGRENVVSAAAAQAAVGGGYQNVTEGTLATIAGGHANLAPDPYGFIGGGSFNMAGSNDATINSRWATVGGGRGNVAREQYSAILGGFENLTTGWAGFIGGGFQNQVESIAQYSAIGGGFRNRTSHANNFIGGGSNNHARGFFSAIVGGGFTDPNQPYNTANRTFDNYCFIGGGANNHAGSDDGNLINAWYATIGGGGDNRATGQYSTVPGGYNNFAGGAYSFAAGRNALANHDNSFVWSGDPNGTFTGGPGQFVVNSYGGTYVFGDHPSYGAMLVSRSKPPPYNFLPPAMSVMNSIPKTPHTLGNLSGIGSYNSATDGLSSIITVGPQMGVQGYASVGTGLWGTTQIIATDPNQSFPVGVIGYNPGGGSTISNPHQKRGTGVLGLHGGNSGFSTTPFGTRGADFAGVAGITTMASDPYHPTGPVLPRGLYGRATQIGAPFYTSYGVEGVVGIDSGLRPILGTGVYGHARNNNGICGVARESHNSLSNAGVIGVSSDGANFGVWGDVVFGNGDEVTGYFQNGYGGLAGQFIGDVQVWGSLAVSGTKAFRIDHPLDPENKYLQHACIESDAPLNIYSGSVVTDVDGFATVELPAWFEAINADLRYQLTVIDGGDEFILVKITNKVKGNRFTLRTSKGGVEVSWQVTGNRSDTFCRENAFAAEVEKKPADRGRFLYPRGFGQPAEAGIGRQNTSTIMDLPQASAKHVREEREIQAIEVPINPGKQRSEPAQEHDEQ